MRIGLFFGSFNPIHVGHLIIANHVLNETEIKKVWFVVSPQNPLKSSTSLLHENHRIRLVRMAVEDDNRLFASNAEFDLPRPSYTIDTLTYMGEKYPDHKFTVIMGSDSFINLPHWKNYTAIIENYSVIIYERPGFPVKRENITENITIVKAPYLDISSTHIRNLIKDGKSAMYLLPEKVREAIEGAGYYK